MKKTIDLVELNKWLTKYTYAGLDMYFVSGWFSSYLSSVNDESTEDLLVPDFLIFDENKIKNEQDFSKLIDELVKVYSGAADRLYEQNKLLQPVVDLAKPNSIQIDQLTTEQLQALESWLLGYMYFVLTNEIDITAMTTNQTLLDEYYYPALFTLSVILIDLKNKLESDSKTMNNPTYVAYLTETVFDLHEMWESDDASSSEKMFEDALANVDYNDIIPALNAIFFVVRKIDEEKYANEQVSKSLLGKLTNQSLSKH